MSCVCVFLVGVVTDPALRQLHFCQERNVSCVGVSCGCCHRSSAMTTSFLSGEKCVMCVCFLWVLSQIQR